MRVGLAAMKTARAQTRHPARRVCGRRLKAASTKWDF
jgi:hypothetical protein